MRVLPIAVLVFVACARGGPIHNLPLSWRGVGQPAAPSVSVARSFAAVPFAFGLRDLRPDPSAVGTYDDSGFVVRTTDNVAQYCSTRLGELLTRAGARLDEPSLAVLEVELLDYSVAEGGMFNGLVRVRTVLRRGAEAAWSRTYVGKSRRWGRTHNPDNFNEALSNALASVASQLVQDEDFARALAGEDPPSPPPPHPGPSGS